jgi:hypothetical protein
MKKHKKNIHSNESRRKQMKKTIDESSIDKWLLIDKNQKILFSSENIAEVVEEGRKYKLYEVSIEKKLIPGTCFF